IASWSLSQRQCCEAVPQRSLARSLPKRSCREVTTSSGRWPPIGFQSTWPRTLPCTLARRHSQRLPSSTCRERGRSCA
ncbi:unnamed protein product, partial [Polarella glacialis]